MIKISRIRPGLVLAICSTAVAQQYVISTIAGGAPTPTPISALSASLGQPATLAIDPAGNIFSNGKDFIFKLDASGVLTRVAGNSRGGYFGDGGLATNARIFDPGGLAVDGQGNLYIADTFNNRVRKVVLSTGIITTIAGNGVPGFSGDDGLATHARLNAPYGLAIDGQGHLFIADTSNARIRKIDLKTGIITTVAGNGTGGNSGDGGPATSAQLSTPYGVAVDHLGNVYIADTVDNRVRVISASSGIITTIAGNGSSGSSGDGGPATSARLTPFALAVDNGGNLLVSSLGSSVRVISAGTGIITTIAGDGQRFSPLGDGGPAINANMDPAAIASDNAGNLYIADYDNNRIRKVSSAAIITTVAGNGTFSFSGDGGQATSAQMYYPTGVAKDSTGNLFIADCYNRRIRKVPAAGIISTVAGDGDFGNSGDGGPSTNSLLALPWAVTTDRASNLYIADPENGSIRKISPNGTITTIAGAGTPGITGYSGDGGPATNARLFQPDGVVADTGGNLYIADSGNNRIRKVSANGIITTVAGDGTKGYSGDGGLATNAQIDITWNAGFGPAGSTVAVDSIGNLFIADYGNNRIRKVSSNGIITTVAGDGTPGYSGDGALATKAQLNQPSSLAVDSAGTMYIAEIGNNAIRAVSPNGVIRTIAGAQGFGYSGDNGPALRAQLTDVRSVAVDNAGNIYLADTHNNAVRLLQQSGPALSIDAVVSAASGLAGAIAPGEIVVLYGSLIGPPQITFFHIDDTGLFNKELAGTTVQFNGRVAPIIYTSANQVAAIVPYEIPGTNAQVTVTYLGQTSSPVTVSVASSVPAIFTVDSSGKGQAAAINEDGSINTAGTPARIGSVITLFATGEGKTSPSGVDGKPAAEPLPHPILPVTVTIGGQTAQVQYAGGAPGEVAGVMQFNVQIPPGVSPGGSVPVILQVGDPVSQQGVTIAVQ